MEDMKREEKSFGNFGNIDKMMKMNLGKMSKIMGKVKKNNKMKNSTQKVLKGKKGNYMHMETHITAGKNVMKKDKNGKVHSKVVVKRANMMHENKNGKVRSKCNWDTKYYKDGKLVKDRPKGCPKQLKNHSAKRPTKSKKHHTKKASKKNSKRPTKKVDSKKPKTQNKTAKKLVQKPSKGAHNSNKKRELETDPDLDESRRLRDEYSNHLNDAMNDKSGEDLGNKKNKNSSYMHSEAHVMSSVSSSKTDKNGKAKSHGEVKTANMMHENKNGQKKSKCNSEDKKYNNGKLVSDKPGSHDCQKVKKDSKVKILASRA